MKKRNRPEDKESKRREEEMIVLQNRLSEVIGKLSISSEKGEKESLEQEYEETLGALKKLKANENNTPSPRDALHNVDKPG